VNGRSGALSVDLLWAYTLSNTEITTPKLVLMGHRLTQWVGAVDLKRNRCYDYIFHIEIRCCYEAPTSPESVWLVSL